MRLYRLTAKGHRQLGVEESRWHEVVAAMARILKTV
jgi:hypothetical protein